MRDIEVYETGETEGGWEFHVVVRDGTGATEHRVSLNRPYWELLTGGPARNSLGEGGRHNRDELVRRSFEFLLARESKESILPAFNLRDITRYFPEYEQEIKKRFL